MLRNVFSPFIRNYISSMKYYNKLLILTMHTVVIIFYIITQFITANKISIICLLTTLI